MIEGKIGVAICNIEHDSVRAVSDLELRHLLAVLRLCYRYDQAMIRLRQRLCSEVKLVAILKAELIVLCT